MGENVIFSLFHDALMRGRNNLESDLAIYPPLLRVDLAIKLSGHHHPFPMGAPLAHRRLLLAQVASPLSSELLRDLSPSCSRLDIRLRRRNPFLICLIRVCVS